MSAQFAFLTYGKLSSPGGREEETATQGFGERHDTLRKGEVFSLSFPSYRYRKREGIKKERGKKEKSSSFFLPAPPYNASRVSTSSLIFQREKEGGQLGGRGKMAKHYQEALYLRLFSLKLSMAGRRNGGEGGSTPDLSYDDSIPRKKGKKGKRMIKGKRGRDQPAKRKRGGRLREI